MEPLSAPAHRDHVPWKGLLLAVSLLTFWIPPSTTQLTIESLAIKVGEWTKVLLIVRNMPENPVRFNWYKGESVAPDRLIAGYETTTNTPITGPINNGQETLYTNGSLLLRNVNPSHSGYYTLQVVKRDLQNVTVTGELEAYMSLNTLWYSPVITQLTVQSMPTYAVEGQDVLLLVHNLPKKNLRGFTWYKGTSTNIEHRILGYDIATRTKVYGLEYTERQSLYESSFLLFLNVSTDDTGNYTLEVIQNNLDIETVLGQLRVYESVAQPSIEASNTTVTQNGSAVLTCLTVNSGVSIQWFFNGQSLLLTEEMQLSQDNITLTIEPVRRNDAGDYQCEVSNPVSSSKSDPISLQVSSGEDFIDLSGGAIAGIVVAGFLVIVMLMVALGYFISYRRTNRASGQCDLRGHQTPEPAPGCNLYSNIHFSDHQPGLKVAASVYEDLLQADTHIYCRINQKGNMAS